MSDVGALLYADTRSVVNAIRDIRRNRGRLALWAVAGLLFGLWFLARAHAPQQHALVTFDAIARCDIFAGIAIGAFGFVLVRGNRLAGLFANPTEGRWIIGLPVSPFVAAIYVQVRELLHGGLRYAISFGFAFIFYLPPTISAPAMWRDLLFGILALLAIGAIPLPRRLARGALASACVLAGYACIAFAAVTLLHDAAIALELGRLEALLPAWHPGLALIEPPNAHSAAVGAGLVLIVAGAFVALGLAARDALPELYAFSVERLERTGSGRRIGFRFGSASPRTAVVHPIAVNAAHVPSGVAVFLWKAWTEYRRRTAVRTSVLEAGGVFVVGYLAARLIGNAHPAVWFTIAGIAAQLVILSTITTGISVAAEIRRPLFWLSDASLFERLAALVAGHIWHFTAWFLLFAIGLASGHARTLPILFAGLTGPALLILCAAIGTAAFALFPNEIDQRGPLAMLRLVVSWLFMIPAIVAGILSLVVLHSATAALAGAAIVALAEAGALIGFAAWRLDTSLPP